MMVSENAALTYRGAVPVEPFVKNVTLLPDTDTPDHVPALDSVQTIVSP